MYITDILYRDHLKQVLREEKVFLRMDQVNRVNVPKYDELSVKKLWPLVQGDPSFLRYFPDSFPEG